MEFRVLGQISVLSAQGTELDIGPRRHRALLGVLMLNAGRTVGIDRIVEALWDGSPPPTAVAGVHSFVSKIRRVLEPARTSRTVAPQVLVSRENGYRLDIRQDALDLGRLRLLAERGRRLLAGGDPAGAAETLRAALAEWRGDPLLEFEDERWAYGELACLRELRLGVVEDLAEAELAIGAGGLLCHDLLQELTAQPLRERLRVLAAHALYQCGRQAEALALLAEGRRLLAEELGLDPHPRTREMEHRILAQDPALCPGRPAAAPAPAPSRRAVCHRRAARRAARFGGFSAPRRPGAVRSAAVRSG